MCVKPYSLKELSPEQQVCEKAISYGSGSLSDVEVLAFFANISLETARELYYRVIPDNKKLISSMALEEFTVVKGVGVKTAARIKAALDFGKRVIRMEAPTLVKIHSSRDIYELMMPFLMGEEVESFYAVFLGGSNKVLKVELISKGGTAGTVVDAKVLFGKGLLAKAKAMAVIHNHPSGNTKPSTADINLTKNLVTIGKTMNLPVIDHLVYGDNCYYSFADEGML